MAAAWRRERPHSFGDALKAAREMLSASPALVAKGSIEAEAEQLVTAAYRLTWGKHLTRMELFARMQDRFPEAAGDRLLELAGTRAEGKPLQHLTGVQAFLDHEYEVGPDVLVPRPETELLVTLAIESLRMDGGGKPSHGLEIGLGSGVISIELLSAFPSLRMVASELVPAAADRALGNARRILGSEAQRLSVIRIADPLEAWPMALPESPPLDFVISNPPYLAVTDPIEDEVRDHEPATALFAPESDLLHFYRLIALNSSRCLRPGGRVFLELAPERAVQTLRLFEGSGWDGEILPDLAGRDRVLIASLTGRR
jgi:release factor glutamine methyltransferase